MKQHEPNFNCGRLVKPMADRFEYRATCNGDPTGPDEGWTDDRTIAEDEAALLSESLGKTGVRIERRLAFDGERP
jgi:hypothetical protein